MATFEDLYKALKENTQSEMFACGGSISIKTEEPLNDSHKAWSVSGGNR